MEVGVKTGRDNIAGGWNAPNAMTGGTIQAHSLGLDVAISLEISERSAGGHLTIRGSTMLQLQAPLLCRHFLARELIFAH
jgi:hypothetical protein